MKEWEAFVAVALIMIGGFLFTPTSDITDKLIRAYQRRFGIQPELTEGTVTSVTVNGVLLLRQQAMQFIRYFNESNFLSHDGLEPWRDVQPVHVDIEAGNNTLHYSFYVYEQQIAAVRHKKKEHIPYRISSAELREWLVRCQQVSAGEMD